MNVDRAAEIGITLIRALAQCRWLPRSTLEARWIVAELHATAAKVNQSLENYRYDDAANASTNFSGQFLRLVFGNRQLRLDFPMDGPDSESASQQASKSAGRKAALSTLVSVFEASLRLLSPSCVPNGRDLACAL